VKRRDGTLLPRISGSKYPVNLPCTLTIRGRKLDSKKLRAPRASPAFTAPAASQMRFHSPVVIVFSPPSVAILTSGPAVSLGQERRKAASASAWRSSAHPAISL
jgi:hypothetical protein